MQRLCVRPAGRTHHRAQADQWWLIIHTCKLGHAVEKMRTDYMAVQA